ncbi:MAG: hypothetical protein IK152_03125 [Lachnospiraceae bacterium]|nr:hypothetical protein [Lachnospiraceae bacterium]
MRYELIIDEKQPTCGGKSPSKADIQTIETDDPVAYFKEKEPKAKFEVEKKDDGGCIIRFERGGYEVTYEFNPD